jgi:hypothetical protein
MLAQVLGGGRFYSEQFRLFYRLKLFYRIKVLSMVIFFIYS